MAAPSDAALAATDVTRESDREFVVRRTFAGAARHVYAAWTTPEILLRWWAPKSFGITFVSCEANVRVGGTYRFVFTHPAMPEPMAFVGRYLEVDPPHKLVWTNEEDPQGAVTTVTFTEENGQTHLVLRDVYPSKEALDAAIESGSTGGHAEQFVALDALLRGEL